MFKWFFRIIGDVLRQVIVKVLTIILIVLIIFFVIKHFLNINLFDIFGI